MSQWTKKLLSIMLAVMLTASTCVIAAHAEPIQERDNETPIMVSLDQTQTPTEAVTPTQAVTPTEAEQPVPQLSFNSTAEGTVISWDAVEGAAEYALYLHEGEEYTLLTQTAQLSFEHENLNDGEAYSYRLSALDGNGEVVSQTVEDAVNTYVAPPELTALTATASGVDLVWGKRVTESYRVYRRTKGSGWTNIGETEDTTYHDAAAVSGTEYIYTVRCITADGSRFLSYHTAGKSIYYVQTPEITSLDNKATGTRITWNKPAGADKCRLYYRNGSDWVRICETADNSYLHDNLTDGKTYTYTIRGVNSKGNFVTEFNTEGWDNTFIKPPVITSLTNTEKGVEIRWTKRDAAEKYLVYYYGKTGWKRMASTTDTVYLDTDVTSGGRYTYTVRCVSDDLQTFTSDHTSGTRTVYVGVPTISSISNTMTGSMLTWKKPAGADRVRIYVKSENGWTRLTETTGTSYEHKNLTAGKSYTYTIRCVDSDGDFVSEFNRDGWSNTFIKPPVITSFTNTDKGVEIRWGKCNGAEKYRVYYYGRNGWTRMADVTDTVYLDTDVTSGGRYTYTVRCISADAGKFTSDYNAGKKTQYIGVPQITSVSNTETGAKVSWKNPGGATAYRVYVKDGSDWKRLTTTTSTSFVHDKLSNNSTYTYTVRCVDSDGDFVSEFNRDGWSNTFLKPPVIDSVSRQNDANLVKWNAVSGAQAYRLYRKGFNGSWGRVMDSTTATSYADTSAKTNTLYAYTVRCVDNSGNTVSDYYGSNTYYYNGKLAQGAINVNGNTLNFENGKIRTGYQKINGKTYYYGSNGLIQKNGIVGSSKDGYCYADKNGVIDFGYCNGVSDGGDWNVINGKATRVSSESDRTLFRALKIIYNITDSDMSKSKKLRVCFDYLQNHGYTEMNPRIPDYTGMDWPIIYANDIFVDDRGNCLSFAAAFAYMAKGIGYTEVYGCHSGGHGWAEVDGLIYDPEWGMHRFQYSYFGMSYSEPCDVAYASGISAGYSWMHIKI